MWYKLRTLLFGDAEHESAVAHAAIFALGMYLISLCWSVTP